MTDTRDIAISEGVECQRLKIACAIMSEEYANEATKCSKLSAETARRDLEALQVAADELAQRMQPGRLEFTLADCELVHTGLKRIRERFKRLRGSLISVAWDGDVERCDEDAEQFEQLTLAKWDNQVALSLDG